MKPRFSTLAFTHPPAHYATTLRNWQFNDPDSLTACGGLLRFTPMIAAANLSPRHVFLTVALIFGPLFAFLTPPFQVPDEYDHFHRAYQVSEGHLTQTGQGNHVGGYQPRSLIEFQERVSQGIPHHPEVKQDFQTLLAMRHIPLRADDREFVLFPWYSPTNYFPQAAGIAIARAFGGGPLALLYAGRLGNLLVWTLLIYFALGLIPLLNWTLCLLALMPMSLSLAASLSADAMVIAVCFLFVATILRFAVGDDRPITWRRLAALVLLGALLALAKTAYLPLTLLFLVIPKSKFRNSRQYWMAFGVFVAVALAVSVAWAVSTYQNFLIPGASPHEQAIYILHHPLRTLRDYVGQLFSIPLLASVIGKLGWYDTQLWRPLVVCYAAVLVWTTRIGNGSDLRLNVRLASRQRLIIALTAITVWLALFGLMQLAFTRVGARGVTSIQGRYLIPITPLVFLPIYPANPPGKGKPGLWIGGFSVGFCVYVAVALVRRFYIA
jgi:uncharacterized membrane protein